MATIGIFHERFLREQVIVAEQLQTALNSRVIIEQAKGVIAARDEISVDAAFVLLRGYARRHNRRLAEVAAEVVSRRLATSELSRPSGLTPSHRHQP